MLRVYVWQEELGSDHHICFLTLPAELEHKTHFLGGKAEFISLVRLME